MDKTPFQILDQMNQDDTKNGSANLALSNSFVELKKVSGGYLITMGISDQSGIDVFTEKCFPVIMLIDKKEHDRLKNEAAKEVSYE